MINHNKNNIFILCCYVCCNDSSGIYWKVVVEYLIQIGSHTNQSNAYQMTFDSCEVAM